MERVNRLKEVIKTIENYLDENPDGGSDMEYHIFQFKLYKLINLPMPAKIEDLESDLDEMLFDLKMLKERMGWE